MSRQARIDIPGVVHHVIVRGLERKEIFLDDSDRGEFLYRLEKSLSDTKCLCYAWALIPNHFHLLIRTGEKPLSSLMLKILSAYAVFFNRKHRRCGYLYQSRYKSILCQEDKYFLELIRYIHLNPLRSGNVRTVKELDNYPWAGHSCLVGKIKYPWQNTEEVLALFAKTKNEAIDIYRDFVKDGFDIGRREDLTGGGLRRSAGGWGELLKLKRNKEYWRGDERILGDGQFVERIIEYAEETFQREEKLRREGWTFERLQDKICDMFEIGSHELLQKGRSNNRSLAKGLLCYWAYNGLGIKGSRIARHLGITSAAVTKNVKIGEEYTRSKCLKLIS